MGSIYLFIKLCKYFYKFKDGEIVNEEASFLYFDSSFMPYLKAAKYEIMFAVHCDE